MQFDVQSNLAATDRAVSSPERDGQPARAVMLSRAYATTVDDLWHAVTTADRIPRYFAPVTGDLELGGRYQVEGNAGGTVTECEPPSRFALTWEFGGDTSWVEFRVAGRRPVAEPGSRSPTPRSSPSTGTPSGRARSASAGRWDSSDLRYAPGQPGRARGRTMEEFVASPDGRAFIHRQQRRLEQGSDRKPARIPKPPPRPPNAPPPSTPASPPIPNSPFPLAAVGAGLQPAQCPRCHAPPRPEVVQ